MEALMRRVNCSKRARFGARRNRSIGVHLEPLGQRLLLAAGDPDFAFSGDGRTSISLSGQPLVIMDTAVAPDGKVIVGGHFDDGIGVARLKVDGSLDTSFSQDGIYY